MNGLGDIGQAGGLWEQRGAVTLRGPAEHPRSTVVSRQGGNRRSQHLSEQSSSAACRESGRPHS